MADEDRMMRVSDYVFKFLKEKNATHVFMVPGGGAMYLVDSLGSSGLSYVCVQHEQAAACAAEAYGQHTNKPGVVLVTAGPGGTNTITGVAAAWIDSTPMFVISGQAKRADLIGDKGIRQGGSQEVKITEVVKPITKYAVQIMEPDKIRYHMEKAYHEASTGRMGPVWLDIPLDVQSAEVDEEGVVGFFAEDAEKMPACTEEQLHELLSMISVSQQPVLLAGNGVKAAEAEKELYSFVEKMQIPVFTTWKSLDMFDEAYPLYIGHPGVMGDRGANFALQESDLLIILGSRTDNSITAYNEENFAPHAKKVVVDIDINEIKKFSMDIALPIHADVKDVLQALNRMCAGKEQVQREAWIGHCKELREQFPVIQKAYRDVKDVVSTYYFIDLLSEMLTEKDVIVPESSGGAAEITCQAFRVKHGQKMKHAAGLGSMGFGLPYSIGACLANDGRRTILINGDGAFQLNIQELETLHRLQLPVKIFILNNSGYASIRAMQRNNFEGHYVASSDESGITMPNISRVAEAYGIKTYQIFSNTELEDMLEMILGEAGPSLCEIFTSPEETVSPRVKTTKLPDGTLISSALENMWPYLENR